MQRFPVLLPNAVPVRVRPARFLQQGGGPGGIRLVGGHGHIAVRLRGGEQGLRRGLDAAKNALGQELLVDGTGGGQTDVFIRKDACGDGLHHLRIGLIPEHGVLDAHAQVHAAAPGVVDFRSVSGSGKLREAVVGELVGTQKGGHLPALQGQDLGVVLRDLLHLEGIHVGGLAPVPGIADKGIGRAVITVEHIGAGAHGLGGTIDKGRRRAALEGFGIHDGIGQAVAEVVQGGVIGARQGQDKGGIVRCPGIGNEHADLSVVADVAAQVHARSVDALLHRVGGEGGPVGKFHAAPEAEGVDKPVVADLPALRQAGRDLVIVVITDQGIVEVHGPVGDAEVHGGLRGDDGIK